MQLSRPRGLTTRWLSVALFVALSLLLSPVRTHANPEVGMDVLGYTNDDSVQVITPQLWIREHLDEDGGTLGARVAVDVVSAASVDIVSTASYRFDELRTEVAADAAYRFDESLPKLNYRYSGEPDYTSHALGAGVEQRLGGPDSVLGLSYSLTLDTIGMVGTPAAAFSESLAIHLLDSSVTQVLSPNTVLRVAYSLAYQVGYMEKPYRSVPVFTRDGIAAARADGVTLGLTTFDDYRATRPPEAIPDTRHRHALSARLMTYVESIDSSLRLDYRFYVDSWSMLGNTLEPAIHTRIADDLRINLWTRAHHQNGADFWQRVYVVDDPLSVPATRSIDEALSPQLTLGAGVRGEWQPEPLLVYLELAVSHTRFLDYLLLDSLLALTTQLGVQWSF